MGEIGYPDPVPVGFRARFESSLVGQGVPICELFGGRFGCRGGPPGAVSTPTSHLSHSRIRIGILDVLVEELALG